MKIAISNIAWNRNENNDIFPLLRKYDIHGLEVSLTKIWDDPFAQTEETIKEYRSSLEQEDIQIIAMQSLLYGHPELTIFESEETRKKTLDYLSKIIAIASLLGIKALVFGSPANRKTHGQTQEEALEIGAGFFSKLGDVAKNYGCKFCIEPNPASYGTDFINTTQEAIDLVKKVNHPFFRLHLDTGTMTMNNENYQDTITKASELFSHFHISEPQLVQIGKGGTDHEQAAAALKDLNYSDWVSIEMRAKDDYNSQQVQEALDLVTKIYD